MGGNAEFFSQLTAEEKTLVQTLDSPLAIQSFLDTVQYPSGERNRCVLSVLRERQGHCLDGGLFAAAALSWLGYPPLLVDLLPEPGTDDDHILAVYRVDGRWGAVAKSNFVGLRLREPVYKSIRELVMSYFDVYFNTEGQKTLRGFTRPIQLARFHKWNWLTEDTGVDKLEKQLYKYRAIPLITPAMASRLQPTDPMTFKTGLSVANWDGLFRPKA
jgi:hypothetical protein